MFSFFSAILAFFFSISSFFTVLFGNNLCTITTVYNEDRGLVWECDIANEDVAVIKNEKRLGSVQSFAIEGISEGQTEITLTNKKGETESCVIYSLAEVNPYNGKIEFYRIYVLYDFGTYIRYDEGITLTAETPVEGGYWDFGLSDYEPELASDPKTLDGVCTFNVINTSMTDEKYGNLFTYYDKNGIPLETKFIAYTLKKDGTISYIDENKLAKIELPADFSKLQMWRVAEDSVESNTAEIINIYLTSDTYGSIYIPDNLFSEAMSEFLDAIMNNIKVPVDGESTVVVEALREGTAEIKLEKVDMYPIIETENGYDIDLERCEVIETVTVTITVDENLNISYEIK